MDNLNGIISLFIACLEFILLINLLIFAEKNKLNWIAIAIVFLLMGYQSLEYFICGLGISTSFMTYLAFADITFLPPLNLFFVLTLFGYKNNSSRLIFLPAAAFIVYYFFSVSKFEVTKCTVLYATYHYPLGDLYGFFYYTPILISFILVVRKMIQKPEIHFPIPLKYLLVAHLVLIVPVTIAFLMMMLKSYGLIMSIESILCKFAFFYCLVIVYFALSNKTKTA